MRLLHSRFAVALVIDHDDREIRRLLDADCGEGSETHKCLAVTSDGKDAALRLRECQAEADHRGLSHRAPHGKRERRVACRGAVPGGGAQARNDEQLTTIRQKLLNGVAALHCAACSWKLLMPIRRWE